MNVCIVTCLGDTCNIMSLFKFHHVSNAILCMPKLMGVDYMLFSMTVEASVGIYIHDNV